MSLGISFDLDFQVIDADSSAKKIQSIFRGYQYRKNVLPNSILYCQKILREFNISCSNECSDGRTNSCIDEKKIVNVLVERLNGRIYVPKSRHWYDVSVYDYRYGWIPVNIKSSMMKSSDNTGNLAMCVYALTNKKLDLKTSYSNGKMSKILIQKIRDNYLNKNIKRDYYFIVINKSNPSDIIVNSFKGLEHLTPNINNLPFQVKWSVNKQYKYKTISSVLKKFIATLKKPKPSWSEEFLFNIRQL